MAAFAFVSFVPLLATPDSSLSKRELQGIVVNEESCDGVSGMTVRIAPKNAQDTTIQSQTVTITDTFGRFAVPLTKGNYTLEVDAGTTPLYKNVATIDDKTAEIHIYLSPNSFSANFQQNEANKDIRTLQEKLMQLGYLHAPSNGIYDLDTQTGVAEFQRANRIPIDNRVGLPTWRSAVCSSAVSPLLPEPSAAFTFTGVKDFSFDRHGSYLAIAHRNGTAELKDLTQPSKAEKIIGSLAPILAIEINPTGDEVLALIDGTFIQGFSLPTAKPSSLYRLNVRRQITQAAFSPAGGLLLTSSTLGDEGDLLELWSVPSGKQLFEKQLYDASVWALFDWRDEYVAWRSHAGVMVIVNAKGKDGKIPRKTTTIATRRNVLDARFSIDGREIIVATGANEVKLYDAVTGQRTETLKFGSSIDLIAVNPNGLSIAAAAKKGPIYFSRLSGGPVGEMQNQRPNTKSIVFSADGRWLGVLTEASELRLYRLRGEKQ